MSPELFTDELLNAWKAAHQRLFNEMTVVINERDALRKQLEIAVEALKLADMRLRVNKMNRLEDYVIDQSICDALAEIEKIGG